MEYFLELFLGGLTRGSIYALIALGSPCVRIVVAWEKILYKRENLGVKEVQPCDIHLNEKRRYCVK